MKIILVAAMAHNRVIGKNNELPWHLPADLRHFKAVTASMPVLMGRKTYESIGRPLPKRRNIIITRQQDWQVDGCEVANSIESALKLVADVDTIAVIGGQSIYEQALPLATHMALTFIEADIDGDTYFPAWDDDAWLQLTSEERAADVDNRYAMRFASFERRQ